jgi:GNAT superfamily N-acetyltransferase
MAERYTPPADSFQLRDLRVDDAAALSHVALAAFQQFASHYENWPAMAEAISRMPALADRGEVIVAEVDGRVAGGVAYIAAGKPKAAFFDPSWPIIRMLVVDPVIQGHGIGRALTEECVRRARRDGSPNIALHTTPIMTVALPMYLRMGFTFRRDVPPIHGVPYAVYIKDLHHA